MTWKLPESDTYFRRILMRTPEGFEIDHLEYALRYAKERRLAVDGGAHIGTWTVYLAKHFQHVLAFEPANDTVACLRENVMENVADFHNVRIIQAALGPSDCLCGIIDDPARPGNTGARILDLFGGTTRMDALDSYRLQDLDFLKLDVEGYELGALMGAKETLRRCSPAVMIECKSFSPPRHGGPQRAVAFLNSLGYSEIGGVRNDRVFMKG